MIRLRNGNSLFEEIMESYNLRLDDEFEFEDFSGTYRFHKNNFDVIDLQYFEGTRWLESHLEINLIATLHIKRKPFIPKSKERYYFLRVNSDLELEVGETTFMPYAYGEEYSRVACGNCFRSRSEMGDLKDCFQKLYGKSFDKFKEEMTCSYNNGLVV